VDKNSEIDAEYHARAEGGGVGLLESKVSIDRHVVSAAGSGRKSADGKACG